MLATALPSSDETPLDGVRHIIHIALHFIVPAVLVAVFWRGRWWQSYLWLLAGLVIDVDHLLANPVYDPLRCSVGFHPLHTWPAAIAYIALCAYPRTRLLGVGLVLHLVLDAGDCVQMPGGIGKLRAFLPW